MAWAQDETSFDVLRELLGDSFDSNRHRLGVDVAFELPAVPPRDKVTEGILGWLHDRDTPIIGINVSGLLMNRPEEAAIRYGLKANYGEVIIALGRRLLADSNARILLIPHVVCPAGHYESDIEACELIAALGDASNRLAVRRWWDPRE